MPTGAPDQRKTHVVRLFGTNANGDVLPDIWVDIERMDIIKSATQNPQANWQGHQRKLLWLDDPTDPTGRGYFDETQGNPARIIDTIKIYDVNTYGVTDKPDEWINVQVVRDMKWSGGDGLWQGYQHRYKNASDGGDSTTSRVFKAQRFVHYDTNIDDAAQAAVTADPTLKAYVVQGSDYQINSKSKDDTQWIEHEVPTSFKASGTMDAEVNWQAKQSNLLNQYLIDMSVAASGGTGDNGVNPPFRLDPYQNIINVKFNTVYLYIRIAANNACSSLGPTYSPVGQQPLPAAKLTEDSKGVKRLDSYDDPGGNRSDYNPALGFFQWIPQQTCVVGWDFSTNPPTPIMGIGFGPDIKTVWDIVEVQQLFYAYSFFYYPGEPNPPPVIDSFVQASGGGGFTFTCFTAHDVVQSGGTSAVEHEYLYRVPAGTDLFTIEFSGLVEYNERSAGVRDSAVIGAAMDIDVMVWSRAKSQDKKPITKINQLIQRVDDPQQKPSPDDERHWSVQGPDADTAPKKFKVGIKLDKDITQTDNYGQTYHPYKVIFDPTDTSVDIIPFPQPPPRLG